MLRPSPNHGTQRLPNDDDDDENYVLNNHGKLYIASQYIYITIAALYAKICPQNLTKIYPSAPNSTAIIAYIFLLLHLANPLPLCDRFLRLSFVFYDNKIIKKPQMI